jgi:hypothetical protein
MRKEIAVVAGPKDWGVTRESWLARVPEKVSTVSFRTVKALWYGEITDPDHWAVRDIRRAAELLQARREAQERADQLANLIAGLTATDAAFHEPTLAALVGALRNLRGETKP